MQPLQARGRNYLMKMVSALPALLLCILGTLIAAAQTNVTTYHYDNARSGQNTKETILTPLNVNSTKFGKKFSVSVDGQIYAQPLYMSNLTISRVAHNVVRVVIEHHIVYAMVAGTGIVPWH